MAGARDLITVAGFNTAIDRRIDVEVLQPGMVQRASSAYPSPGGKGLHVAQTLAALGESAHLVGLDDGAHHDLLLDHLKARRVTWHGARLSRDLRQCLAIHEANGRVTEILEPGPALDVSRRQELMAVVDALIDESSALVLSGSLPRGFSSDTYARLIRNAKSRGVPCLLDASNDALRLGIEACPWLVKPNADEAAVLWGKPVQNLNDAAICARWLHARGVARVVITLGQHGAVAFDGNELWHAQSTPVEARNSVGSGDCFLAGLAVGVARGESLQASLRRAVACGAANAESDETGFASLESVTAWMLRINVRPLRVPAKEPGR